MTARCFLLLVVAVMMAEGVDRGSGTRETYTRRSKVDMNALREKYEARLKEGECTIAQPSPGDPPLPSMPNSFMTEVEFSFQSEGERVMYGVEMFDSVSMRGVNDYYLSADVMLTRPEVLREVIHYNHPLDEALFILTEDPCIVTGQEGCAAMTSCRAGKIKDIAPAFQEIFGVVNVGDGASFMGAAGLLMFGPEFNYTFIAEEPCHGARCQVFEACITQPDGRALLYTYYWTETDWDVQNNGQQVPLMLNIYDPLPGGMLLHINFFDFRREWRPALDELEAPANVYCLNRESYLGPPKTRNTFFYRSERVEGFNLILPVNVNETESFHVRSVFPQQEWYDYDMRISRTDYIPLFIFGANRRFENLTQEILEFNQKLRYRIQPRRNVCNIKVINNSISWGDIEVGEDGSIHMMNPWDWEGLDIPMQYNGLHWERGMSADVWVGQNTNPTLNMNETVVWYFASPFSMSANRRKDEDFPSIVIPTADRVPIKLEKYLNWAEALPHFVLHMYDYEGFIPLTHTHDISVCFGPGNMRHFTFDLPHNAIEKSLFLREHLKYGILGALHEAAGVSPLRINRLELNKTKEAVQVTFTLLDRASDVYMHVTGDEHESNLNDATNAIRQAVDTSQLIILVQYGNNVGETTNIVITTMTALPGTMKEIVRDTGKPKGNEVLTGFSPGDMAGLAIGMIILGTTLGYGGMYFFSNKK